MPAEPPPPGRVLAAFGVHSTPDPLPGGRGLSWRSADVVLKQADATAEALEWEATTFAATNIDGLRVAPPIRATTGAFIVEGWSASAFRVGRHEDRRWPEIIAAGRRFHQALRGIARPRFLSFRDDPWAIADRVAWGEIRPNPYRDRPLVARLEAVLEPLNASSQVIHGDLTGNVLFADSMAPAVIDLSAYWRPSAFADAIVIADALVWEGADASVLEVVSDVEAFGQFLIRALLFRVVAGVIVRPDDAAFVAEHAAAVDLAVQYTRDDPVALPTFAPLDK